MKIGLCLPSESDTGAPMLVRLDVLIESSRLARDYGFDTVQVGQHYVQYPLQAAATDTTARSSGGRVRRHAAWHLYLIAALASSG